MSTEEIEAKRKQEITEHEGTRPGRTFVPDVDIYENEEALWLWADVPGTVENEVVVELNDDVLSIEAKVALDDYKELKPVLTEYNVGPYARRFSLPRAQRYDRDHVEARMENGVLAIKIPRLEKAKPKRIQVSVN